MGAQDVAVNGCDVYCSASELLERAQVAPGLHQAAKEVLGSRLAFSQRVLESQPAAE